MPPVYQSQQITNFLFQEKKLLVWWTTLASPLSPSKSPCPCTSDPPTPCPKVGFLSSPCLFLLPSSASSGTLPIGTPSVIFHAFISNLSYHQNQGCHLLERREGTMTSVRKPGLYLTFPLSCLLHESLSESPLCVWRLSFYCKSQTSLVDGKPLSFSTSCFSHSWAWAISTIH